MCIQDNCDLFFTFNGKKESGTNGEAARRLVQSEEEIILPARTQ